MIKGIYKVFKQEMQNCIKVIAEVNGITPLEVIANLSHELSEDRERIEQQLKDDFFDIPIEDIKTFYDTYIDEINQYISPQYIPVPKESKELISSINRRMVDEGYAAVEPDALSLIIEEYILPNCEKMKAGDGR